jgi:sugar lactone lactonase YvrE
MWLVEQAFHAQPRCLSRRQSAEKLLTSNHATERGLITVLRHRFIAIALGAMLLAAACSTESGQSPAIGSPGTSQPVGAASPTAVALLWAPEGLAFGADGTLYASDCVGGRIYRVDPAGVVTVFAGTGVSSPAGGLSPEGVPATQADLHCPMGLAFNPAGNLLVVDHANNRVRAIGPDGLINTIVGSGPIGTSSDDGDLTGDGGRRSQRRCRSRRR